MFGAMCTCLGGIAHLLLSPPRKAPVDKQEGSRKSPCLSISDLATTVRSNCHRQPLPKAVICALCESKTGLIAIHHH